MDEVAWRILHDCPSLEDEGVQTLCEEFSEQGVADALIQLASIAEYKPNVPSPNDDARPHILCASPNAYQPDVRDARAGGGVLAFVADGGKLLAIHSATVIHPARSVH